jgi:quercetin dioxygenase-like cupin family protein
MRTFLSVLAGLLVSGAALAADPIPDAVAANPEVYKVLKENAHVRVLEVRVARGGSTKLHAHPDHTVYIVKGGTIEFTDADGKAMRVELKAGEVMESPALVHAGKNVGKTELVGVITELKDTAYLNPKLSVFERAELVAMLEHGRTQTEELVARAQGDLWAKKPGEGRWSVSEIVEHLGLVESLLFGVANGALAQPEDPNWRWMAASMSVGSLANRVLDRSRKAQAPEPAQPKGGLSRAEAMSRYGAARAVTIDFVSTTDAPLKAHTATAPPGTLSVHQYLALIALHNMRHNEQIAEALAQLGAK